MNFFDGIKSVDVIITGEASANSNETVSRCIFSVSKGAGVSVSAMHEARMILELLAVQIQAELNK